MQSVLLAAQTEDSLICDSSTTYGVLAIMQLYSVLPFLLCIGPEPLCMSPAAVLLSNKTEAMIVRADERKSLSSS